MAHHESLLCAHAVSYHICCFCCLGVVEDCKAGQSVGIHISSSLDAAWKMPDFLHAGMTVNSISNE